MPTVPSVPSIPGIIPTVPTVPSVPGVMPTVPTVPTIPSVVPTVAPTIPSTVSSVCHLGFGTVAFCAEEVLPSLFDDVIQGGIGRFKTYRCVGADIGVSIPNAQHRSRSEPNTEDLQAVQKGAPREPFVIQLPLYLLGLMLFLPITHSRLLWSPCHEE